MQRNAEKFAVIKYLCKTRGEPIPRNLHKYIVHMIAICSPCLVTSKQQK